MRGREEEEKRGRGKGIKRGKREILRGKVWESVYLHLHDLCVRVISCTYWPSTSCEKDGIENTKIKWMNRDTRR